METTRERNRAQEISKPDVSGLKLRSKMDDFKVAGDSTDIRGWDVIGGDGRKIGKVEHLLVDPGAMTVRYLGVDLDRDLRRDRERHSDRSDHVLIPVDRARIGNDHRHSVYVGRNSTEIGALPSYDHNSIQRLLHGSELDRVHQSVPVMREEVTVEHRPATRLFV